MSAPTTKDDQGHIGVCTLLVCTLRKQGRAACHQVGRAESKLQKCEWRPSHTSEHPAARETYSNSGGTATHRPDHSNRDQLSEAKAVAK
jgi:hypothetical protein